MSRRLDFSEAKPEAQTADIVSRYMEHKQRLREFEKVLHIAFLEKYELEQVEIELSYHSNKAGICTLLRIMGIVNDDELSDLRKRLGIRIRRLEMQEPD